MDDSDHVTVEHVVTRIAAELGEDVLELEPLGEVIDPELVRAFLASEAVRPGSELRFQYEGHTVTIDGNGSITVEPVE